MSDSEGTMRRCPSEYGCSTRLSEDRGSLILARGAPAHPSQSQKQREEEDSRLPVVIRIAFTDRRNKSNVIHMSGHLYPTVLHHASVTLIIEGWRRKSKPGVEGSSFTQTQWKQMNDKCKSYMHKSSRLESTLLHHASAAVISR